MLLSEQEELAVLLQEDYDPESPSGHKLVPPPVNYTTKPSRIVYKDNCHLSIIDPWDPSVHRFMKDVDTTKNCDRTWTPYTELKDGHWRIVKPEEGRDCLARCFKVTDFNGPYNHTEWFPPGPVDCEFLEAACWKDGEEVYGYIHTQFLPKMTGKVKKSKSQMKNEENPDVYVLLIDSLSRTGGKRSIPKTIEFFQSRFQAVDFPHMSQVGTRSKENALALWFGKQIENGTKINGEPVRADWTDQDYCEKYLDEYSNIFRDFMDGGYTVLHSEDWSSQTVNTHPTCKGFKNQYSDHTFYPFTRIYDYESLKITQKHLDGKEFCREPHMAAMEYLEEFAEAYEDRPKFVWQWFVHLAHNHLAGANRGDPAWEAFLKRNAEKLDKSFVILMADHGFRFGPSSYYKTDIGKLERINPMFYISVPKKYRDNGMMEVLQENSKRLQTHYDTRATLLDILKYQPPSDYTNRTFFQIPNEKGQSLIRRQPRTPRNCETLPILQNFCLCGRELLDLMTDEPLKNRLSEALISHVHRELDRLNLTSLCERFEVEKILFSFENILKRINQYVLIKKILKFFAYEFL
ncbi:hypothetical protein CAEBREN_13056 [Caenorhabditis brenneri]|uniref:Uncharacterized protein n=1 Tax=Caenorhabditis brenneri TaxID=135651 RepID=G0P3R0_CAEBE|nr:hypothetical protein CAEBREN_13056 [Caenorhabditis brenneri]